MSNTVPAGWNRTTLGKVAKLTMGQSPLSDTYNTESHGLPFFQGKADFGSRYPRIRYWCSEPTKVASEQSILFSVRAPVGEVNITPYECCIGRGLAGIYGETANQEFLFQKLQYAKPRFQLLSQGSTFEAVNGSDLKEFDLTLPPLPEQQKIATILSSVDDVIEKTRAQIDKLKDLKIGMRQELLTKGIGHTEFKDSPVGLIPLGWRALKLKEMTVQIRDGNYGADYPKAAEMLDSGVPFLTSTAVNNDQKIDFSRLKYISAKKHAQLAKAHIKANDILFTNRGANVGNVALVPWQLDDANIGPQLTYLRVDETVTTALFLYVALQSSYFQQQLRQLDSGSAMNFFGIGTTEQFMFAVPPIDEQSLISDSIYSVTRKIDDLNDRLKLKTDLKKALMQDLRTGKVRVKLTDKESAVV